MKTPAERLAASKRPATRRTLGGRAAGFPACRLRELRTGLGLTLRDVENGTGVGNGVLSQIERGVNLTLDTAFRIAAFFGKSVEDIWPRESKK